MFLVSWQHLSNCSYSSTSHPPSHTSISIQVQVPQFRAAGLDVTALYSRDPQRAAALAEQHKLKGFSDDHALINSTDGGLSCYVRML